MNHASTHNKFWRTVRARRLESGFTLIELLVVVTIIVVLLALLVPAMDKAIYQAELMNCGATLKAMGTGVTTYAFENKRYYPDRTIAQRGHEEPGKLPINPQTARRLSVDYDIRPLHAKIFSLNKTLQCPLNPQVNLETAELVGGVPDPNDPEGIDAGYAMWWAWQYKDASKTFRGQFKIGDKFQYNDLMPGGANKVNSFSVLAGDIDLTWGGGGGAQATHPDRESGVLVETVVDGDFFIDGRIRVGRWTAAGNPNRGLLDTNYVFADGSVSRYNKVTPVHRRNDSQMTLVPINFDHFNNRGDNVDKMHVPKR